MALSVETVDVLCHGETSGAASLTVQGGTEPYAIDWQGAAPESLAAGVYTVVVIDDNACEASLSFNIVEPGPLAIDLTTSDVNCAGDATGTVEVSLSEEQATWTWHVDASDVTSLPAGNYTVTATDANNCSSSEDFTISQNPPSRILHHAGCDLPWRRRWIRCIHPARWTPALRSALDWRGSQRPFWRTPPRGSDRRCRLFQLVFCPNPRTTSIGTRGGGHQGRCIDGTGSVGFEATGGSGTYIVDWDGLNLNATPIGTHNYTVSDTNGCMSQGSVTVYPSVGECGCTEPSAVNFDAEATENDGSCVFRGLSRRFGRQPVHWSR